MSSERETDRRLRSWAGEGVDRAPERFVWAALDEIERVPQRRPWRATIERLTRRARPAAALLAAAVVVVAVGVTVRVALPNVGTGPGGPRFTEAGLADIVVWEDTMPGSWHLDNLVSNKYDVWAIPLRSAQALAEADAVPGGYLGGRYTDFTGSDALYMSWATLFARAEDAAAAMPFIERELESSDGWGYGPGQPIDLGEGGNLYAGETTAFTGPPGTDEPVRSQVYLWRNGNVLLALGGWFDINSSELRDVAVGMDARATAIAEGQ